MDYNILDFGAVADGLTVNTEAIQKAIDKAEEAFSEEQAENLEKKLAKRQFDLDDYLDMMTKVRKMGSFKKILSMLPGIPKEIRDADIDEKQIDRINAIVTSMTKRERRNPKILDASRRKRIAAGSGNKVEDINRFINQFNDMQKMMKKLTNNKGKISALKGMGNMGNFKF